MNTPKSKAGVSAFFIETYHEFSRYNDCHTLRHSVDSSDEEDLDRDLDLHSLILSSLQSEPPNVQSADEVIQQIEDIMAVRALLPILFNC